MTEKPLLPATWDEISQALGYALQFDRSGKAHRHASDMTAQIAADALAEHLKRSGFVLMKKPPAQPFTAPSPYSGIPLKD